MIPIPQDFFFAVAAAGFKRPGRNDLAAILSGRPAVAAGVFTTNAFKAAPVLQCQEQLAAAPRARGLVVNSGQANACTGDEGRDNCRAGLKLAAKALGVKAQELLPASTGVIGAQLKMELWKEAMPALKKSLGQADVMDAARAIMTTDSFPKVAWRQVDLDGRTVTLLGLCKGAGMISPQMATMLSFLLCDADVETASWQELVAFCAEHSFNRVTVDGDTSTNDCLIGLANGASGAVVAGKEANAALRAAALEVCQSLAYKIVQDAEGGTKVARISVSGAASDRDAELAARAIGNSPLVKTALFGCDPNWGRIVAAVGRSGARFQADDLVLTLGGVGIFAKGRPAAGDLDGVLASVMQRQDIEIGVSLGRGKGAYTLLASDLTKKYVEINADYRT